jgi:hypothetical protein
VATFKRKDSWSNPQSVHLERTYTNDGHATGLSDKWPLSPPNVGAAVPEEDGGESPPGPSRIEKLHTSRPPARLSTSSGKLWGSTSRHPVVLDALSGAHSVPIMGSHSSHGEHPHGQYSHMLTEVSTNITGADSHFSPSPPTMALQQLQNMQIPYLDTAINLGLPEALSAQQVRY